MGWKHTSHSSSSPKNLIGLALHDIGFWGRREIYKRQGGKVIKIGPDLNPMNKVGKEIKKKLKKLKKKKKTKKKRKKKKR